MRSLKKVKKSKSFPWKVVFGAIAILGVTILLTSPNDQNFTNSSPLSETSQKSLSGFNLNK